MIVFDAIIALSVKVIEICTQILSPRNTFWRIKQDKIIKCFQEEQNNWNRYFL